MIFPIGVSPPPPPPAHIQFRAEAADASSSLITVVEKGVASPPLRIEEEFVLSLPRTPGELQQELNVAHDELESFFLDGGDSSMPTARRLVAKIGSLQKEQAEAIKARYQGLATDMQRALEDAKRLLSGG